MSPSTLHLSNTTVSPTYTSGSRRSYPDSTDYDRTPRISTDNCTIPFPISPLFSQFGGLNMELNKDLQFQQQLTSSYTQGRILPTPSMVTARWFLLTNVCFADFPHGSSNRFTTLMHENFECGYCYSKYRTLELLKRHLSHADHPVWICCNNLYRTRRLRDDHRRDYDCQSSPVPGTCALSSFFESTAKGKFTTDMKTGKCGYCGKETGGLTQLRNHLKHEGLSKKGHSVWYSHGRFFKELKEMNQWKELCELGEKDEENAWLEIRDEVGGSSRERDEAPAATWVAS